MKKFLSYQFKKKMQKHQTDHYNKCRIFLDNFDIFLKIISSKENILKKEGEEERLLGKRINCYDSKRRRKRRKIVRKDNKLL